MRKLVGIMSENSLILKLTDKAIYNSEKFYTCKLSPFDADLQKVSQYMTQAILLEVVTHPKPGLITRYSNGSHSDMSIFTFMMSSAVLGKAFNDLQEIGQAHNGRIRELLPKIRNYGIKAEKEMLFVTKGVNTQRGILFAGGIVSAAAGYAMNKGLAKETLLTLIKKMTCGLVEKELINNAHTAKTAGEKLYNKYGITGIRGEVEKGFPSIEKKGLPALRYAMARGASINDALIHTLISLMTVVEDSNVVWRTDYETLLELHKTAENILQLGSIFTSAGRLAINDAEKYFEHRRISPGGSADLLSVTVALYLLEQKEFPQDIF